MKTVKIRKPTQLTEARFNNFAAIATAGDRQHLYDSYRAFFNLQTCSDDHIEASIDIDGREYVVISLFPEPTEHLKIQTMVIAPPIDTWHDVFTPCPINAQKKLYWNDYTSFCFEGLPVPHEALAAVDQYVAACLYPPHD